MENQTNLTSPATVKSLLSKHGLRPKKRLGQSFLIDRNILDKILNSAELSPDSQVLEIGPGLGTVTRELASRARNVAAIEIDKNLIPILHDTLAGFENVEIIEVDFLKLPLDEFLSERFGPNPCSVVANLPYYITTPIIVRLLETKSRIQLIVIMAQREVARRLVAAPGSDDYGAITVFVQYHCEADIVAQVSRNVFYPPPEVDSALVRLRIRPEPAVQPKDEGLFFKVVRAAFGQRRKTILNALSGSPDLKLPKSEAENILKSAGIDAGRRGETLSLEEFAKLADLVLEKLSAVS
ncbi:MAG: 16S rRNA (adenine(1518)-N(6)/adenine(1519)-N(6))-dimethyltransferase RsmA [Armatimonadota bacterium]|nr:16S rRNA (adenine(1518)-N(6)/adenine(1519)-N(6))-dimethyltransferase RsmA [Armatimonadota bacterium]